MACPDCETKNRKMLRLSKSLQACLNLISRPRKGEHLGYDWITKILDEATAALKDAETRS